MTTHSIFHQPKAQWTTLLGQRSWEELCEIDFQHVLEKASLERLKIFVAEVVGRDSASLENAFLCKCITPQALDAFVIGSKLPWTLLAHWTCGG